MDAILIQLLQCSLLGEKMDQNDTKKIGKILNLKFSRQTNGRKSLFLNFSESPSSRLKMPFHRLFCFFSLVMEILSLSLSSSFPWKSLQFFEISNFATQNKLRSNRKHFIIILWLVPLIYFLSPPFVYRENPGEDENVWGIKWFPIFFADFHFVWCVFFFFFSLFSFRVIKVGSGRFGSV